MHTKEGQGVVRAALDAMCPVHGTMRGKMKSRAQMILESLRDDLTVQPCRHLTPNERTFVKEAEAAEMIVVYNRRGKPFAWGAPKVGLMFSNDKVASRPWLFDIEKVKSHFYWLS